MNAQEVDAFFYREVGLVWGELRGRLWHSTGSHRFRDILAAGEIHPTPNFPRNEFRWAEQGTTYCRSIDAVSLFDFAEADWSWLLDESIPKVMPRNCWGQFLKAPSDPTPANVWISTVWLAVERSKLANFIPWKEVKTDWQAGGLARKWMPCIEACHKGLIPLSACSHVVVVCAVNEREFCRMALHPFDLSELDRIEGDWCKRFAERYTSRALSVREREQVWLEGLKTLQLPESYKPGLDLAEKLREAKRRVKKYRTKRGTDTERN